jgi:hypothetical protein
MQKASIVSGTTLVVVVVVVGGGVVVVGSVMMGLPLLVCLLACWFTLQAGLLACCGTEQRGQRKQGVEMRATMHR